MPDDCQYVHWFCARNVPFHLFDGARTSLRMEAKVQLCSEGPLECNGRCKVCISSSYCLKYRTCELPSPTLRPCKTVQLTLNVISATEIVLCVFPALWASVGRARYALMQCKWRWPPMHGERYMPIPQVIAFWRMIKHAIERQIAAATWGSVAVRRSCCWRSAHEPRKAKMVRNQLVGL